MMHDIGLFFDSINPFLNFFSAVVILTVFVRRLLTKDPKEAGIYLKEFVKDTRGGHVLYTKTENQHLIELQGKYDKQSLLTEQLTLENKEMKKQLEAKNLGSRIMLFFILIVVYFLGISTRRKQRKEKIQLPKD